MRSRIWKVHGTLLVTGWGLLFLKAVPVYWDGLYATGSNSLWWLTPPALLFGGLGGALEGLVLRAARPAGWVVAGGACLLGGLVPAAYVSGFAWAPADQVQISTSAVATAWLGWVMFLAALTATAAWTAGNHDDKPRTDAPTPAPDPRA